MAKIDVQNTGINDLSYQDLLTELRKPIDGKYISKKPRAGKEFDYIQITDCKDLLDERIGRHRWESSVANVQMTEIGVVVIVKISFHTSDGIFSHDGTGYETASANFGDPASNAYAQAFRRALEGFGFARELWRNELSEEQANAVVSPAQVDKLHELLKELNSLIDEPKVETNVAKHYATNDAELFGDMLYIDASKAIHSLEQLIIQKKRKK